MLLQLLDKHEQPQLYALQGINSFLFLLFYSAHTHSLPISTVPMEDILSVSVFNKSITVSADNVSPQ